MPDNTELYFYCFSKMKKLKVGETILYREIDLAHQIIDVKPMILVEDNSANIKLWCPLGTKTKKSVLTKPKVKGQPREWADGILVDGTWKYAEVLIVIKPNEEWATWIKWSSERVFEGYYINLQSILTRTYLGFDIRDYQLDIEVNPAKEWEWKDQHELEEMFS